MRQIPVPSPGSGAARASVPFLRAGRRASARRARCAKRRIRSPRRRPVRYGNRRLYRKGSSAANGYLVLYCRKNGSQANRVGLTVGAKLAHAVQRNRLRRQLREIYRLHETSFARGYDLVVVARSRAIGADYAALEHAYLSLAARLGLLTQNTP